MRRHQTVSAAIAALVVAVACVLALSGGSSARPTKSQQLFRATLLEDAKTTTAIKSLLRDRGGFVAPEIQFADVTGDGRSDAVVTVETGGAAGAVAVYVFSTHSKASDSPLRAVYRSQQLYRASVQVSGDTLVVRTPQYAAGDDLCCPAQVLERVYAWNESALTLKQRSSQELAGPTATTTSTPPAAPPAQG